MWKYTFDSVAVVQRRRGRPDRMDESYTRRLSGFLKPTAFKGVFVAEWALFIVFELLRGKLESSWEILVASYPLVFFYLVACALTAVSQRSRQLAQGWRLLALIAGLIAVDQVVKTTIVACVPHQTSIPIIAGWLHLAHEYNSQGSWLIATFSARPLGAATLAVVVGLVLLSAGFFYRYYVRVMRQSVWADGAFAALFAALASWLCDMAFRGYVVDFINLPGVVTADFKDILLTIGAAAFVVEALDNPYVSWRWRGWRQEATAFRQLAARVIGFSVQELRAVWRTLVEMLVKGPR